MNKYLTKIAEMTNPSNGDDLKSDIADTAVIGGLGVVGNHLIEKTSPRLVQGAHTGLKKGLLVGGITIGADYAGIKLNNAWKNHFGSGQQKQAEEDDPNEPALDVALGTGLGGALGYGAGTYTAHAKYPYKTETGHYRTTHPTNEKGAWPKNLEALPKSHFKTLQTSHRRKGVMIGAALGALGGYGVNKLKNQD